MECRCLIMPATIPGTPATLSKKTFLIKYFFSVIPYSFEAASGSFSFKATALVCLYPETENLDREEGNPIGQVSRLAMGDLD